jgi:hypothetical protein
VDNRDALIRQLEDHGVPNGKRQVLRAMNSEWVVTTWRKSKKDKPKKIPQKCKYFYSLDKVWKRLQKELAGIADYQQFLTGLSPKNKRGKFINKIFCYLENKLLQTAIREVCSGNVVMPAFDGFLATNLEPQGTVEKLNKLPLSIEYGITWDEKQHDTTIVVDKYYVRKTSFTGPNDVTLVRKVGAYLAEVGTLQMRRGALWYSM